MESLVRLRVGIIKYWLVTYSFKLIFDKRKYWNKNKTSKAKQKTNILTKPVAFIQLRIIYGNYSKAGCSLYPALTVLLIVSVF